MKPAPFDYEAPGHLDEALELLARHGDDAKPLAGGQSLIPLLNFRLARPAVLVDLQRLLGLASIRETEDGGLRLGAMVRQASLERDAAVESRAPLLHRTMPFVAHPQIRNRGTLGGNLAHADPASELPAVAVALDARLRIVSVGGERWVDARQFFVGLLTTAIEPGELLVEIELPPPPERTGWAFQEVARRHGDYAHAGVAARVTLDGAGRCASARLVYLSAGDGPTEAAEAAGSLVGAHLGEATFDAAARFAAEREIEPTDDIHASASFKRHLAAVLTRRALAEATRLARAEVAS